MTRGYRVVRPTAAWTARFPSPATSSTTSRSGAGAQRTATTPSVIRALGLNNDHLYAETPEWLISRLRQIPVELEERAEIEII
jgi:hypothetical protein